jgi:diguanylate cyclase (GGDEF)-like protein
MMAPIPVTQPGEQPAFRAAIVTAKDLLRLPLPNQEDEQLSTRLYETLNVCVPLTHISAIYCHDNEALVQEYPSLSDPLPFTPCHQDGKCQVELLNASAGWCWVKVEHGTLHWLIAKTQPAQRTLLLHLLEIVATHYSLLQANRQLDLFNSPLLNRIPFWQEKLESLTRLLRLAGSLPARQLLAQFDSTLRFWMGAQEVLLIQRQDEKPQLLYPQTNTHSEALLTLLSDDRPQQTEENCLFWYSFPILLRRQYHASLALGLQRPLVNEDRQLLFFVAEELGLMTELYELRQHKKATTEQSELAPEEVARLRELGKNNLRLQKQLKQRDEQERQLQLDSQRDPLTQLANRAMFLHRLDHGFKHYQRYPDQGFAILLVDLLSLHEVNEQYGDELGDLLLKSIAQRLRVSTRQNDLVARLSGDEFIIFLDASQSTDAITPVISRILEQLQQPLLIDNHEITIHACLGVATVNSTIDDVSQLLRQADIATFQAKRRGQDHAVFYSELCDIPDRLSPEQTLHQALQEKRLLPYFQPIMRLRDRRIVQLELLARLLDEEGEIHEAGSFIPLAEQSDLILEIDRMMLRHACGLLQGLFRPLIKQHSLRISINLSGKHLASRDQIQQLLQIIQESNVPPKLFIFEFKERDLTRRDSQTLTLLHELRAKGIGIAVDDFGTGFGSLNALFHYPVDFVKIDDSFTHRLLKSTRDRALIRAIRDISHDLGMQVIVEGVEQREQHLKLSEMGCDLAQGDFFSAPMPPDALFSLLPNRAAPPEVKKD